MKKAKRTTKIFSSLDRSTRPRSANGNGARARWSQYHSLLDSATLSIVETDLSGRIVDCNPVLANLLRSAPEKVKHRKFVTLASEKSRSKEIATRDEVLERGSTDEYEIELMREDGTAFPVIIKKWLQSNRYGKAQRIWMLVRDITEKKKNGDAFYRHVILLLENQLRNQSLLAGAPIGILTIDGNGRIESSNPAAEELLCAKSDEVIRKRLDEFVTSPSGKALSISPGQPQTAVAKWQNGRILPVQVTFSELRTKDELLFTCFLRDMTGDMQIRETLQRAHDDLADRVREGTEEIARLFDALQIEINERTWVQEQFRVAVESAPNGILILNQEGRIVLLNAHVEQIFGYGREELLGRPFELLVAEKYRSVLPHPPENRLAQAQVNWMGRGQELYGLRKDATEFPVEIGLNPIHTPSGTGLLMSVIDVTERKRVESELKRSAFHDGLTGLPNRTLFLDNLLRLNAAAKRHGHHPFALVFLDLDRFKVINDSLGHSAGDKLLIEMSQRLVECTREEDTVARLGGDEFALLLEQVRGPEDAVRVAERVLERLADPLVLDGNEVSITGSIGIALSLTGEKNPEDLLRDADMAMYQAKTRRLGYQIFDAKMHARALDRMRLEIDMKRAIERQQIQLHYQPIISLATGRLAGFEALARWQHDGRGTIPPARFIPLAEETGLVTPLSRSVFRQACAQVSDWRTRFSLNDDFFVSVNVSSKQLSHRDLIDQLDRILQETSLDPEYLRLEITESALAENTRVASYTLAQLRKRRIKLCLDDFGKGFSSLNYLHRFPIDVLKIDRSFVRRLSSGFSNDSGKKRPYEIIRTIVALAQILGMQVVAEGVEVSDQAAILKELGCEFGQGFLFSPALDAASASRFFDCVSRPS